MDTTSPALSMADEYVEVCFPAWPARAALARPLAGWATDRISAGALEALACIAMALAIPGAISIMSLLVLSLLIAWVLLAPAALVLFAWTCWRHDQELAAGPRSR